VTAGAAEPHLDGAEALGDQFLGLVGGGLRLQ
jgi:hypothetical protein